MQELLHCFNNDFENNLENNAWNLEHNYLSPILGICFLKVPVH